ITEQHVAGYLAKYVTKSTETTGLVTRRLYGDTVEHYANPEQHTGRLIDACWTLGRPNYHAPREVNAERPYAGLRRWAHQYGHGGHITTKSRRYSVTLTALRAARQQHTLANSTGPDPAEPTDTAADEHNQAAKVVITRQWRYLGTGWK